MICRGCKRDLSIEYFSLKYKRDGTRHPRCKPCRAQDVKRERAQNPQRFKEQDLREYWKDPVRARAQAQAWRAKRTEEQLEKGRQRKREWQLRNPGSWKNCDQEKARSRRRKWEETHPEIRALIQQNREARKRGDHVFTQEQLEARLSYFAYRCWICGDATREMDHVIPLAKNGRHLPANIRPICRTCNSVKSSTVIHNRSELLASTLARSSELKRRRGQHQSP